MGEPVDLSRPTRLHLVGVGGAGMGAIAEVLVGMGHCVSGSDLAPGPMLDRLARLGVRTFVGHDPAHVGEVEMVAASTAVPADNAELNEARRRYLPVLSRADVLAGICAERRTVAVSGTHGKTTTSTMVALALEAAGFAPSWLIGGDIVGDDGGARWEPASEWLVVEADESDGTFLRLPAEAALVTSVDADHLDYWGDEARLRDAFGRFLAGASGPKVVCVDDPGAAAVGLAVDAITYGTDAGATVVMDRLEAGSGGTRFRARRLGAGPGGGGSDEELGVVRLAVPGVHFAHNACGALAMAVALGADAAAACAGLARYRGVARRFETRGLTGGITLVDDYAHLPAEVKTTLSTARQGGWRRVVAVFQPHRYSRTASLWRDFADAFDSADILVVTDVYPAGESPVPGVTGALIADAVRAAHPAADVRYEPDRGELGTAVAGLLRPGDVCLSLGAGDITRLPAELLTLLRESRA